MHMYFLFPSVALRILLVTKSTAFSISRPSCECFSPEDAAGCRLWDERAGSDESGRLSGRRRADLLRKTLVRPCEIGKCICTFCSRQSLFAYFWSQKVQHFRFLGRPANVFLQKMPPAAACRMIEPVVKCIRVDVLPESSLTLSEQAQMHVERTIGSASADKRTTCSLTCSVT